MFTDPYTPDAPVYECYNCGTRVTGERPDGCPDCDSGLKNISVPRE